MPALTRRHFSDLLTLRYDASARGTSLADECLFRLYPPAHGATQRGGAAAAVPVQFVRLWRELPDEATAMPDVRRDGLERVRASDRRALRHEWERRPRWFWRLVWRMRATSS